MSLGLKNPQCPECNRQLSVGKRFNLPMAMCAIHDAVGHAREFDWSKSKPACPKCGGSVTTRPPRDGRPPEMWCDKDGFVGYFSNEADAAKVAIRLFPAQYEQITCSQCQRTRRERTGTVKDGSLCTNCREVNESLPRFLESASNREIVASMLAARQKEAAS